MDSSVYSILFALVLDGVVFLVLVGFYAANRQKRSLPLETETHKPIRRPQINEANKSFLEAWSIVYSTNMDQVYILLGERGFNYLLLQKYIAWFLLLLGVTVMPTLIMVYSFGSSDIEQDMNTIGSAHIIENRSTLSAVVVFFVVVSGLAYLFIFFYYKAVVSPEVAEQKAKPQDTVALIKNLPRDVQPEQISRDLKNYLIGRFGVRIREVLVVPEHLKAYSAYLKHEEVKMKLEYLEHQFSKTGIRPTEKLKVGRVDSINYNVQKLSELKTEILQQVRENQERNSGLGFVFFKTAKETKDFISSREGKEDYFQSYKWEVLPGPTPSDLIWENAGSTPLVSFKVTLYDILFALLFFLVLTPTTFSSFVSDVLYEIGVGSFINGLLSAYLPSLILLLYQSVLLPQVVKFLVSMEKHFDSSDSIISGLKKFMIYLIFYLFLFPLMGLQFVQLVYLFVNEEEDWRLELARNVSISGLFFTVFLVNQSFLKNGFDLLNLGKYLKSKAKALIATTDEEKAFAFQADQFKFDEQLAISLSTFIIVLSFSVVYPLILVPGLFFFVLRFYVHKYNLLYVYYVDPMTSGMATVPGVVSGLVLSVFTFQLLTSAILLLSDSEDLTKFGSALIIFSIVVYSASLVFLSLLLKKIKAQLEDRSEIEEPLFQADETHYLHPFEEAKPLFS